MRALVVSYVFPPTGGAGVGRPLKLVKYLGRHGVQASVLTAANPSVPVQDQSLLRDVPRDVEIERVRTFEPGYAVKRVGWAGSGPAGATNGGGPSLRQRALRWAVGAGKQALVPDPQVLWQPAAQVALGRRLARGADDVILISAPPFSQFMLAPLARVRPGVGVVLDYRDEWSTVREVYEMNASLPARAGAAMETLLLRSAHMVTTATEAFRQNLLTRFSFLHADQVVAIPNGYDPDDFPATLPGPPADARELTVTYAGTIFKLTSARGLLGAVRRLHQAEPELARRLRVRFLGRIVETELETYEGTEALGVERLGYLPHDEITRALAASHIALCLLDEAPFVERIYPAKIFELMYLAKTFGLRVLTLSPPGVLADLVAAHRVGPLLAPRDEEAIAAFLAAELRAFVAGQRPPAPAPVDVARYDRQATAGEFARVMSLARARAGARN
ncbi:MAG TPA: glycosyltransferase [Polyangia bacterium]|nr:glycosyltransferase [Polyangia bacterium]